MQMLQITDPTANCGVCFYTVWIAGMYNTCVFQFLDVFKADACKHVQNMHGD